MIYGLEFIVYGLLISYIRFRYFLFFKFVLCYFKSYFNLLFFYGLFNIFIF